METSATIVVAPVAEETSACVGVGFAEVVGAADVGFWAMPIVVVAVSLLLQTFWAFLWNLRV